MQTPQLYQLLIETEKSASNPIADLLENIEPTPLSVSHFEAEGQKWHVTAHYENHPEITDINDLIEQTLGLKKQSYTLEVSELENKDWVSHVQSGLKPVKAGRFFIYGSHDQEKAKNQPFSIEINAAQAFGTAHHGTTEGCLRAIDGLGQHQSPKTILDLGTGTAILAIAAGQLWPDAQILATDIDPVAIKIATENIAINGNNPNIKTRCSDGVNDKIIQSTAPFELVIANILAKPLISMAPEIAKTLAPNATLLLSGILETQAQNVIRAYKDTGLIHTSTKQYSEWVTILFENKE